MSRLPLTPSQFPDGAVAIIQRPARSAVTSGMARTRGWKLRFDPRTPRYIEPLMGWTGHDDTLAQVELSFPSREAAVAYAQRNGLQYVVRGDVVRGVSDGETSVHRIDKRQCSGAENFQSTTRSWRPERIEPTSGAQTIGSGVERSSNTSLRFAAPQDVLHDSALSQSEKYEVLRRWAFDTYRTEMTLANGDQEPNSWSLDEVIDALIDLERLELGRRIHRASRSATQGSSKAA